MKSSQFVGVAGLVVFALIVAVVAWARSGYGEVSDQTYEFSKAIYSACLAKNEVRLDRVQSMLDKRAEVDEAKFPVQEQEWLRSIIATARKGNWESAAKKSRQLMQDQVKY